MTRRKRKKKPQPQEQWLKLDLHIHTPASEDYQQQNVSILDILLEAEAKDIDILAFTDHNTVAGYRRLNDEIADLELLQRLNRLTPDENRKLQEYQRLTSKILLLKGFEFTATFGFHILGIFPSDTSIRDLEFLLLKLNIPPDRLDSGSTEVGASTDVLSAYRLIHEAGGIVIAAHANSSHGVVLQGISFGGQTRVAFTQDPYLDALEVTDLEKKGKRTTVGFFDGSKPEYPRRMRCIQGSDAHRLTKDPNNARNLGVGDRVTEILLNELSFTGLREVLSGDDFARTRPYRPEARPVDYVQAAREEGSNIVQEFYERYSQRGGFQDAIIADVCAFANTNGGTIYIGVSSESLTPPQGVGTSPDRVATMLNQAIQERITPELAITVDVQETQAVKIVRIIVPKGSTPPYAVNESQIYIRSEAETTLAVRDEIVTLVQQHLVVAEQHDTGTPQIEQAVDVVSPTTELITPPRTGVEIASIEVRNQTRYYTMRDLRNGNLVKNVTRRSARHLWRYAIEQAENNPVIPSQVRWLGNIGIWKQRDQGNQARYDFVQRDGDTLRVYYGVTEAGIDSQWSQLIGD